MQIDANLLPLWGALYRTGSVSAAAREVGLSQSAASHALGRLREQLGDPLFVRTSRGVAPTDLALALRPEVEALVAQTEALARRIAADRFDPATTTGRLVLATTDYFEVVVLSELVPRLAREAPGLQLSVRPAGTALPKDDLERGRVDLAIAGFYDDVPEGFYSKRVLEDRFRTAIPRGARPSDAPPTEAEFFAAPHALVTIEGDFADRLAQGGLRRGFRYGTTSFTSLAWVLPGSGLWLTAPGLLLARYAERFPVDVHPCPVDAPPIALRMYWHARTHRDPLRSWFRTRLEEASRAVCGS